MIKGSMVKENPAKKNTVKRSLGFVFLIVVLALSACSQNRSLNSNVGSSLAPQNFVERGFSPKVGDVVKVRVFDETGDELVTEKLAVTEANLGTWRGDLAAQLSSGEAARYLQTQGDSGGLSTLASSNQIYLKDAKYSYVMGLDY